MRTVAHSLYATTLSEVVGWSCIPTSHDHRQGMAPPKSFVYLLNLELVLGTGVLGAKEVAE